MYNKVRIHKVRYKGLTKNAHLLCANESDNSKEFAVEIERSILTG